MTQIDELDCELIESKCIARAASNQAKVTGALAAGAAIGLSIGIAMDKKSKSIQEEENEEEEEEEYPETLSRKSRNYFEYLKSSMIPIDEQLENMVPRHLIDFVVKRVGQPATGTCSCSVSIPLLYQQECSTTCLSSARLCGDHFCTRTSVFNAFLYPTGDNNELTTQTFLSVNNKDCEKLKADCITSSAVSTVAKFGAVVGLLSAALSSGIGAAAKLFALRSKSTEMGNYHLHSNSNLRRKGKEMNYFDFRGNSSFVDETSPILESSIVQEKNLKRFPRNLLSLFGARQEGENTLPKCTCDDPSPLAGTIGRVCSTTCRNSETLCSGSRTCYRSTTFMAIYSLLTGSKFAFYDTHYLYTQTDDVSSILTRRYSQIDEESCEILESKCSAKNSIAKARQSAADVAALSFGLAAGADGISLIKAKYNNERNNETYEEDDYYYSQDYYKRQKRRRKMLSIKERKQTEFERWRNNLPSSEFDPSLLDPPPHVESSMQDELNVPTFGIFSGRQAGGCVCNLVGFARDGVSCTTTCFSFEQPYSGGCGYCTRTSVFEDSKYLIGVTLIPGGPPDPKFTTISFLSVDNKDCEKLLIDCSVASSTIAAAGRVAAIAAGVGGGLSAGIAVAAVVVASNNNQQNDNNNNNNNQQSNQLANQIPANNLPFPVIGINFPDDGSGDSSVRFPDGNSYSIFSRGPCNQTNLWVTVDPISLQGGCTPRLCEDERVFVGRTGLCHHINDPLECQGGRRLYYTAYGDPICDCPIGQYPFPDSTKDDCVSLFSRVLVITPEGRLNCEPLECQSINGGDDGRFQQLVPDENGICFALGSRGPCSSTQLLGYDVFTRQLQCVVDPFSPDSFSSQQNDLFHEAEDKQLYSQDYISERIEYLIDISLLQRSKIMEPIERQETAGILQLPSSLPDSLLHPCRTGARQGANFKCANPLVSDSSSGGFLPPVPPLITCPADSFLQATGSCVDDSRAASCGPSSRFNEATGRCRSLF
uniref:DUF4789 domain-containing protein n=1 Tax=Daphnia galeata TaxID=27404 RepID=A0A8J2RI38_9CRUS|nr:unnamed protein product [Daphnia galeata]